MVIKPAYAIDIGQEFLLGHGGIKNVFPNLGKLVSIIISNLYVLAGILLLLLLIFGGFGMIMGAGGGNPEQTAKGGKAVGAALGGFLIIFLSYWIIRIIEVITGLSIFSPGI